MTDLTTVHADILRADRASFAADAERCQFEVTLKVILRLIADIDAELARREDAQPALFPVEPPSALTGGK